MPNIILLCCILISFPFAVLAKDPHLVAFDISTKNDKVEYFLFGEEKSWTLKEIGDYLDKIIKKQTGRYEVLCAEIRILRGTREVTASELLNMLDFFAKYFGIIKIYDESKGKELGILYQNFYVKSRRFNIPD